MKDLVVLLLAGGDSTRFWPLADKNSLKFLSKPLAFYHILQLRKFGFQNVVIVANKENEAEFAKLKSEFSDININIVVQTDRHGMAGAIISAKKYIYGKKLIIRNSSDIYEDLLISEITAELKNNPDGIITGLAQDEYFPGGYLKVENDKIISIIEKPDPQKTPSNIITIVFDYFKDATLLLDAISKVKTNSDDIFEKAINQLISGGSEIKFLNYRGFWGYLKYPWHTLSVSNYFLTKVKGQKIMQADIHKSAIIAGDVFIEEGVKILENTKILGPAYIGKGSIIGQNCLIRESMIGANCVMGYSTEIARSYIGDNCWFHTNYVGDSVISDNVSMGAGTVLANYKLDETTIKSFVDKKRLDTAKVKLGSMIGKNVRIGVNCSVMPGIKVGMNSFVGAAVSLDKDLPDNKYCFLTGSNYITKDNLVNISKKNRVEVRNALKT